MRPSEVIRQAAITARLLGYRVVSIAFITSVISPAGYNVVSWNRYGKVPDDISALGHFLVRLHMEKHYGITTEHYWEDSNVKG